MPATTLIYKYPLDLTGVSPDNLVLNEPYVLKDAINRIIVPNYGAFFSDSVKVRDLDSGLELRPDQFKCVNLYQNATERSGLEVTTFIVIVDDLVNSNVEIDYQVIGGEFSYSASSVRDLIESQDIEQRPVDWQNVLDKPQFFPPSFHLHDIGDMYGFEYLVESLAQLRYAILTGDEAALLQLRQHIDLLEEKVTPYLREVATTDESIDGTLDGVVITPLKAKQAFENWKDIWLQEQNQLVLLSDHLTSPNDHQETADQVGLGPYVNTDIMTLDKSNNEVLILLGGVEANLLNYLI